MKKCAVLATLFLTLLMAFSCGGPNPEHTAQDELRDEVFVIHDEVMPKMGDIVRLKVGLTELSVDSLKEAQVKAAISQLEKAEDGMMNWMNEFTAPEKMRDSKSHAEIIGYLNNEKTEISKVRDDMLIGISSAEKILKEGGQ